MDDFLPDLPMLEPSKFSLHMVVVLDQSIGTNYMHTCSQDIFYLYPSFQGYIRLYPCGFL